ncbi:hypothetical protein BDF20DRAFT_842327 [Mycotypha africana]|uniref:uncharacterized protein n=1 Tax=Mycotypha africana TaxID=64632 RepID=UPI0023012CC5|nr:uncharacterized protein BDF20DRAFT_842327 [Mycotypha africana]KAI8991039.1 hypothetical protein BDF20DRAFT_842327 [Mycotypha africana]
MNADEREVLSKLIKEITEAGEWLLDSTRLKSIKSICKRSDLLVECAFHVIMAQLKKKHAQIRYSCVQLIEQLFERSKLFRRLLTDDFPLFIQLTIGAQSKQPLPPPAQFATKLKEYAIALIRSWLLKFNDKYPQIGISYQFLLDNNIVGSTSLNTIHSENRSKADKSARKKAFQVNRYELLKADVEEHTELILDNLNSMQGCFDILIPRFTGTDEADFDALLRGDTANESINPDTYKQDIAEHGLGSSRYTITIDMSDEALREEIHETEDNAIIFDQLREAYTLLKTKHINQVNNWINTLVRIEIPDKAEKEKLVKKLIKLKSRLLEATQKAESLGIDVKHRKAHGIDGDNIESEEEDDEFVDELFEEVEVKPLASTSKERSTAAVGSTKLPPMKRIFPLAYEPQMIEDPTYSGAPMIINDEESVQITDKGKQKMDDKREELLKRAPVVEWGDDLYYWDKDKVQFNTSGIERSHRFMGVGEGTNEIPQHVLEELRKRPVYYKSKVPTDLPICRHPLHNGGLCPRRDLLICPFHGKIIPRDELGRPLDGETASEQSTTTMQGNDPIDDTVYDPKSKKADPKVMNNLWQLLEGDVMSQAGQPRITMKKSKQNKGKPESSLIDIKKKPTTSLERLKQHIDSPKKRKAVVEAMEYEQEMRSRNKKANIWN